MIRTQESATVGEGKKRFPRRVLAVLLVVPVLLLAGCVERVDTVEDLPG